MRLFPICHSKNQVPGVLQQTQSSTGPEPMQRALLSLQEAGMFETLAGCLSLILHMGFGALGGAIGSALITRRRL